MRPLAVSLEALAGKYLKPVLMELGDQSPAIVLHDADLEKAAQMCAQGAMLHQGQVCFSTERIIVHSAVREKFENLLVAAVKNFESDGGAVTTAGAQKAKATIDDAVKDGARFLFGSSEMNGAVIKPSILTDVNPKSSISTSEAFAPTVIVTSVNTIAEAIEEANSRSGGLSAAVFTTSFEKGLRIAQELDFGQVQINNMTLSAQREYSPAQYIESLLILDLATNPTTGFKGSGWGSNGGRYGIEEFLFNKAVSLFPSDAEH